MSQPHSGHTYMEGDMCLSTTGHAEGCARSFLMQALCKAEKAATILGDRLFIFPTSARFAGISVHEPDGCSGCCDNEMK